MARLAAATGASAVDRNFPYRRETPAWRPTPLLIASANNGWQFLLGRIRRRAFRVHHVAVFFSLLSRAEHTVFLAGSCGLELLRALDLPAACASKGSFIAYGPVAKARPACAGIVVRGQHDWVARPFQIAADHEIDCGHLTYLESPAFFQICVEFTRARGMLAPSTRHAAAL